MPERTVRTDGSKKWCRHSLAFTDGGCGIGRAQGGGCKLRQLIQEISAENLGYILSILDDYAKGCPEIDELKKDIERRLDYLNGSAPPEIFIG